jgi:hypothetical protein
MEWESVGFVAKRRVTRAGWVSPWSEHPDAGFPCFPPVDEICSVSNCIANAFEGIGIHGNDNPLGLFTIARLAWSAVPVEARTDVALYAYRLWPVQFADGREKVIAEWWWDPPEEPISDTFVRLGWDAVEGGNGLSFGCSPLSCNNQADILRFPQLNRHCLMSEELAALDLARSFSISKPEPGPYCVVEVWRDRAPGVK